MCVVKAAALLERNTSQSCETAVDAFHSLARYVDAQYQSIVDHMNSSAFEAKQAHIRMARNDTEQLKKLGQTARYSHFLLSIYLLSMFSYFSIFCYLEFFIVIQSESMMINTHGI